MENPTDIARVTPSLHPSCIEALEGFEENKTYLAPAQEAFSVAFQGLQKVHDAREMAARNAAWNEEGKILIVSEAAEKVMTSITRRFDSVRETLQKQAVALDEQLARPLAADAERPAIAAEIRSHVKGLSLPERFKFLNRAHEEGDHQTLRACLGAPGYLIGIEEEERQSRTRAHHEKHSPEAAGRLATPRAAVKLIEERAGLAFTQMEKAIGAPWARVNSIRTANNKATLALKLAVG